jgi:Flp pilus assembly protein TadB
MTNRRCRLTGYRHKYAKRRSETHMSAAELTERLPDVKARLAEVREDLPDENLLEAGAGAFLISTGAVASVFNVARGRRGASAWVLPAILLAAGLALLITGTMRWRTEKIESAEARVRAELDALDPFARAQVLKDMAQEQVEHYVPREED